MISQPDQLQRGTNASVVGFLILLAGCASPSAPKDLPLPIRDTQALEAQVFRLGPNDIVQCAVHGHPELTTPSSDSFVGTRIDPDGHLSLGLIGAIQVEGLTLQEARAKITEAYASFFINEPRIEFSLVEYSARRFYLYGEIDEPGAYTIDRPLSVYEALTFGKGFRQGAMRNKIVLMREGAEEVEVFIINGEEPTSAGLMAIQPDDFLFVMRTGSGRFREEALPIITGISASFAAVASILLVEDRLRD
jgi:protein involved in polysaccharide export with SLBB domain